MKQTYLSTAILVVIMVLILYCCFYSTKEHYSDLFYNKDLNPNVLTRPTFNTNLDPRNLSMRSDPNVYGGFIRGSSPPSGELAAENMVTSSSMGKPQQVSFSSSQQVQNGNYTAGINDAAQYVGYSDYMNLPDFAKLAGSNEKQNEENKYKSSITNQKPNTLEYTLPSELLPVPDMRQTLMRDPSDPSNFIYDRTIFAPLKKRNHNEADRFRGDLDIKPIKTGYFDVATVPQLDLVKGYFSFFNDIQEYQDIQDIAYARSRDVSQGKEQGVLRANNKLSEVVSRLGKEITKPNISYATPPPITVAPHDKDPWYSENTGVSKREFEL